MKYTQEIEILIKNIKIISLSKIKLIKEDDDREKSSLNKMKLYAFWLGLALFFYGYEFLNLGLGRTLILVFLITPFAIPLQMFIRWLTEKTNNKDGYLTTKDLNRHMNLMDQDINSEERELFEKLSVHIHRVSTLINKCKSHPSKVLYDYIHCQYFQISEIFNALAVYYKLPTHRNVPFEYNKLQDSFRSLKDYFISAFYPSFKLIEIK